MMKELLGEWAASKLGMELETTSLIELGANKIRYNGFNYYTIDVPDLKLLVFDDEMKAIGSINKEKFREAFMSGDGIDISK